MCLMRCFQTRYFQTQCFSLIFKTLVSVLLCLFIFAYAQTESRYRVAVVDFAATDLSGSLSEAPGYGLAMATAFQTALVQSSRFTVLTRADLGQVLDELALSNSGVIEPSQVQAFGELSGAEILVSGSLVYNGNFQVTVNFISVATGEISAAASLRAETSDDFARIAAALVDQAVLAYPQRGRVIALGERSFIDVGSEAGLGEVSSGTLYRELEVAGRRFSERIGRFEVHSFGPEASSIQVSLDPGQELQLGDLALFDARFEFDISTLTVNTLPDTTEELFGRVVVELYGDNIPLTINIFTAEGELSQVNMPFTEITLFRGDYIATPYGADALDQAPSTPFSLRGGEDLVLMLEMGEGLAAEHTESITHLAYSPDGQLLASGARDKTVRLRRGDGSGALHAFSVVGLSVEALAFSSDSHLLAAASDREVYVWHTDSGDLYRHFPELSSVTALAFDTERKWLYVAENWDDSVHVIDLELAQVLEHFKSNSFEYAAFDVSAERVVLAQGQRLEMLNSRTGVALATIALPFTALSVAVNVATGLVAVGGDAGQVYIYTQQGELTHRFRRGSAVEALSFVSDGTIIAAAEGYNVRLWSLEQDVLVTTLEGHDHFVSAVAMRPDGSVLASGSWDKTVRLWQLDELVGMR